MKLNITYSEEIEQSKEFAGGKFGITDTGFRVIAGLLRDNLYSDKIGAPIREYICNAYDSHIAANKKHKPIRITIPNALDPNFKVRDYGVGLSKEDVYKLYTQYGESTKRNTNKQIGAFGIGCKSAFAVTDSFIVTSFFNGTKTIYSCYLNEYKDAHFAELSSVETEEENGVEIIIPVSANNMVEWQNKIWNFIENLSPEPIIIGGTKPADFVNRQKNKEIIEKGEDWEVYRENYPFTNKNYCLMGIVKYEFDFTKIVNEGEVEIINLVKQLSDNYNNILIKAGINKVDITPSRENLEYTEKTKTFIKNKLIEIIAILKAKCEKEFIQAKSLYEAKCLFASFKSKKIFHNTWYTWKGKNISENGLDLSNLGILSILECGKNDYNYYRNPISKTFISEEEIKRGRTLYCKFNQKFIIVDTISKEDFEKNKVNFDNFIGPLLYKQNIEACLLLFVEKEKYNDIVNEFNAVYLSSLKEDTTKEWKPKDPNPPPIRSYDPKNNIKTLEYNGNRSFVSKNSWNTTSVDLKDGTGYYVLIDRYNVINKADQEINNYFLNIVSCLKQDFQFSDKIHGFKISLKEKIGKGWINLLDIIEEKYTNEIKKCNFSKIFLEKQNTIGSYRGYYGDEREFLLYPILNKLSNFLDSNHEINILKNKILEIENEFKKHNIGKLIESITKLGLKEKILDNVLKNTVDHYNSYKKYNEIFTKYPLIEKNIIPNILFSSKPKSYRSELNYEKFSNEEFKAIADYIKLIDENNKKLDSTTKTV